MITTITGITITTNPILDGMSDKHKPHDSYDNHIDNHYRHH
jgi:hypothetical protein